MPVVGHAIIGVAAAVTTGRTAVRTRTAGFGTWALCLVCLSYLPDVAEQALGYSGEPWAAAFSHSVLFALAAGAVLSPVLARIGGTSLRASGAIAIAAILAHDALDMLQSPDRMPAWPISDHRVSALAGVIPASLAGEVIVLLPLLVLALVWRRRDRRTPTHLRRRDAIAWALVVAIGGSAAVVNHLRGVRERELHRARALVEQHDYAGALSACDRADRWPSAAAPGRIDYIRAEAWWGLGNRQQAERYYLSSRRLDPTYFWTVADLAVFYASGEKPLAQRRRDVAPWLQLLESEFAGHPALARTLDRVRRRLGEQP